MKFTLAPLALLALAGVALAQEPSSSSASASSVSSSSAAAPASSSAAAPASSSSSSSAPAATSAPSGGNDMDGSKCALLPGYEEGKPLMTQYGCTQNASTSTPTYDSTKLQSYLIGAYTRQKEGEAVETVAHDLAKSVVQLYPTLTVPLSEIQESYETAISASIDAARQGKITFDPNGGYQAVQFNGVLPLAAVGAAVLAGGAMFF